MKKWYGIFMAIVLLFGAVTILPIHGEAGLYDNVIRLHVLANSDGEEDQALKLAVRDAVLKKTEGLLDGVTSRAEAEEILRAALPAVREAALEALAAAGSPAPVQVTLTREQYPTRKYESLAFPAGEYLSLRVMIDEAKGKNWWCVLFPPLCVGAASAGRDAKSACLAAGLTGEQYRVIADTDSTKYKLRFKILEVAGSAFPK